MKQEAAAPRPSLFVRTPAQRRPAPDEAAAARDGVRRPPPRDTSALREAAPGRGRYLPPRRPAPASGPGPSAGGATPYVAVRPRVRWRGWAGGEAGRALAAGWRETEGANEAPVPAGRCLRVFVRRWVSMAPAAP